MAVMHLARAIDPALTKTKAGTDDLRGERKELLDRIEGQTKAVSEITGAGGTALMPLIKIVFEGNNQEVAPAEIVQEASVVIENGLTGADVLPAENLIINEAKLSDEAAKVQTPKIEFE